MKKPTDDEVEAMRDKAASATSQPPKFPGMNYTEGVRDALEWVLGDFEGDLEV